MMTLAATGSRHLRSLLVAFVCVAAASALFTHRAGAATSVESAVGDLSVAFLGDQGAGGNARAVLELVVSKDIDLLVLLGDFGYAEGAATSWIQNMEDLIPSDVAVIGVVGNHENFQWPIYRDWLVERATLSPDLSCTGNLGVKAHCTFRGLSIVQVAPGIIGVPGVLSDDGYPEFIEQSLADDPNRWRVCSWHMNQRAMQIGGKGDATGWGVYEACREAGGIVATAHEHSYSRTWLMDDFENQSVVNRENQLEIGPGQSFAFVSGLGGNSVRPQIIDGDWWAAKWSSTQGATHGALFCQFGTSEAECHFEDLAGAEPDRFTLKTLIEGEEPTCGSPNIDSTVDGGVHVWRDCNDGLWTFSLTGNPGEGGIRSSGKITSSLGFQNVTPRTVEASDTLATPNSTLTTFALTTGSPWSDQFEFSTLANDQICLGLTSISGGEQLYIGPNRTPVGLGPINPETLQTCSFTGPDCSTPAYDRDVELALVTWVDCSGVLHLVAMGGQSYARFSGNVTVSSRFASTDTLRFESSDSLVNVSPSEVSFDMGTGGGARDEILLVPADDGAMCIEITAMSSGTILTAGSDRTQVTSAFNPLTGESCTPFTGGSECGDPEVNSVADSGLFVSKDCDGTWSVTLTGTATGGGTVRTVGSITSSAGFTSITPGAVESFDSVSIDLGAPVTFVMEAINPWQDDFTFTVPDGARICVNVDSLSEGARVLSGSDRRPVGTTFDPETNSACL